MATNEAILTETETEQHINVLLQIERLAMQAKDSPEVESYLSYIILLCSMQISEWERTIDQCSKPT